MRGAWQKSPFAPVMDDLGANSLNLTDLVNIVKKEDAAATRTKATEYVQTHGTLLAAELNDWCYQERKRLRDERAQQKLEEEEAARDKMIEQKIAMRNFREKAREAKRKEKEDAENKNSSDESDEDDDDGG